MLTLATLRQFVAIGREGSLTRAAAKMGVTQPTLSIALGKLEGMLGIALVNRAGRGVKLTEAGKIFYEQAAGVLRQAEGAVEAVRQVRGLERGQVRIGGGATAITFLLPRVISAIRRTHPGLRFYVREGGSSAVAEAVLRGELDLGIVTLPVIHPEADRLTRVPLAVDELRLIVPPGHALAKERGFRWAQLRGAPLVAFEAGSAVRDLIDRAAAEAGVSLEVVMELRSIESIKRMVAAGIGVGFVSRFALAEGEGLTCREGKLARRLAIVRPRGEAVAPAAGLVEGRLVEMGGGKGAGSGEEGTGNWERGTGKRRGEMGEGRREMGRGSGEKKG
ncbi:LysR family transcriptional regulator [soil metagenome]